MEMTGEYRIPAPRETVWAALNDPEVLKACIPGCESLDMTSATEMTAKVTTKIGPVKATFTGAVTLSDIRPPEGYTISGEGKGGPAGFAKGGAEVNLAEDGPDATVLSYTAKAQVGGKLAQIGARLIDSTAKKLADEFFGAFAETVGGRGYANLPAGVPVGHAAPTEPVVEDKAEEAAVFAEAVEQRIEAAARRGAFGGPLVWGVVAVIVVVVAIYFLSGR